MKLLILLLQIFYFQAGNCRGPVFQNIVYALRGYNVRTGNPFANFADPGFATQIFVATKRDRHGHLVLQDGITSSGLSNCHRSMRSKAFSTLKTFR